MRQIIALALSAAALLAAGCGSKKSSSTTSSTPAPASSSSGSSSNASAGGGAGAGGGASVKLTANPDGKLAFVQTRATAKAGKVTITMSNPSTSGVPHGISVEGHGVDKDGQVVQPGSTSTITVALKPGTYEYYCPVPAHKQAGMEGKLVVQ